jgi:hypothetical protein
LRPTWKYKLAISYAGEDVEFVGRVAQIISASVTDVFYDKRETVDLIGNDLPELFQKVFSHDSEYVVVFASRHYVAKPWPRLEFKYVLSGVIGDRVKVIPFCLDATDLPGLPATIGRADLRGKSPEFAAAVLLQKIGMAESSELPTAAGRHLVPATYHQMIAAIHAHELPLSARVATVLALAAKIGDRELTEFFTREVTGYSWEVPEHHDARHRSIEMYCTALELSPRPGWSTQGVFHQLDEGTKGDEPTVMLRKLMIPDSLSLIESKDKRSKPGCVLKSDLPMRVFVTKTDTPDLIIHCYARDDIFAKALESIKEEILHRIGSRLRETAQGRDATVSA